MQYAHDSIMPAKVKLNVVEGPMKGREFVFDEHDTFLFGRTNDCHICLPDDGQVSRHHFILEANPPDARVRDLGSLNGTYVNGAKQGGRAQGETPEEGAQRVYPEVDLKNGDRINIGESTMTVSVEIPVTCADCGGEIGPGQAKEGGRHGVDAYCRPCWEVGYLTMKPAKDRFGKGPPPLVAQPVRCKKCGKDAAKEVGNARRGDYICENCRHQAGSDPLAILLELLRGAGKGAAAAGAPKIAGYEVERMLGKGGFGAVYLARRTADNQRVAVKVMLSRVAVDENNRQMFLREIETTKTLRHDHIVPLLESGSAGGAFYFILDFCDGGSVDGLMARKGGKLKLAEAAPIMLQSLDGLAFAHARQFIHRDLKPANILLAGGEGRWTAKVSDFGLAKNFQRAGFSGMTVTGSYAGTPPFMPREQVTNFKYIKPATDVWSMAATFYNLLTGQVPRDFQRGKDPIEIILRGRIVPIRERDPALPKNFAGVIDAALANDPKDRFADAAVFKRALEGVL